MNAYCFWSYTHCCSKSFDSTERYQIREKGEILRVAPEELDIKIIA